MLHHHPFLRWTWRLALGLLGAMAGAGCKQPPNLEQECQQGNMRACAQACRRGVHGPAGCLAAAKDKNPLRRAEMFAIACRAGNAAACIEAAQASTALGLVTPHQVRPLLEHACAGKQAQGCRLLGDFHLFDGRARAQKAYVRACQFEPQPAKCHSEIEQRMQELASHERACQAGESVGCERQLALLAARNHDAAYVVADAECRRRGLTEYYAESRLPFAYKLRDGRSKYSGCGLFLLARAATDPKRKFEFQRVPLPSPSATELAGRVEVANIDLYFRTKTGAQPEVLVEVKSSVREQLQARVASATHCYRHHLLKHPKTAGTISANFVVDRLGDVLDLRESSTLVNTELRRCVVSALIPESFTGAIRDLDHTPRLEVAANLIP